MYYVALNAVVHTGNKVAVINLHKRTILEYTLYILPINAVTLSTSFDLKGIMNARTSHWVAPPTAKPH